MKIGQPADLKTTINSSTSGPTAAASPPAAAATPATAIPAKADASARIQLSNAASSMVDGSASPEFDAEKVARVSKSIEDGSFKIDPAAIADKLISNAKELLTRAQR